MSKRLKKERNSFADHFSSLERKLPDSPSWLVRLRRDAMENFSKSGFPTIADEDWRYTNVSSVATTTYDTPPKASSAAVVQTDALAHVEALEGPRCFFLNGRFCPELSQLEDLDTQIQVRPLGKILQERPDEVEPYLGHYLTIGDHPFATLNTAFIEEGAVVRVAKGSQIRKPIHLVFVSVADSGNAFVTHPRNLIVVGESSQCAVVEHYLGVADGPYFTNPVTELVVEENANVEHYRIQVEGPSAQHVSALHIEQAANSTVRTMGADLGGKLTRNDLNLVLGGQGAEASLDGIFIGSGKQIVDNHTRIEHAAAHCSSRELYKGILGGHSRGVFRGRIVVQPGAQKTDSEQTNNNLLLSDRALVNTKPQLEIYADDVKCTHGATIGQLDKEAIFYMRSRGISKAVAQTILTYGFAEDLISRVGLDDLRDRLSKLLLERLPEGRFLRKTMT